MEDTIEIDDANTLVEDGTIQLKIGSYKYIAYFYVHTVLQTASEVNESEFQIKGTTFDTMFKFFPEATKEEFETEVETEVIVFAISKKRKMELDEYKAQKNVEAFGQLLYSSYYKSELAELALFHKELYRNLAVILLIQAM